MGIIIAIVIFWNIVGLIIKCLLFQSTSGPIGLSDGFEYVNPVFIYKNTRVNWFGAIILTLYYSLLCPIGTVCYWFYKLCTVGR